MVLRYGKTVETHFILFATTGILSLVGLPKIMKVLERESAKLAQEADLSAPLGGRDFFTSKGWLKLAFRWGLWKTVSLFYLSSAAILGGMLFALSIFYGLITIRFVATYTITFPLFSTYMLYRQIRKGIERADKAK